jgi:AraC-like DNA-binding protein
VILHLDRRAVPVPERALRDLSAGRLATESGAAAVLRRYLLEIAAQGGAVDGPAAHRLGTAAVELAAAVLAERADAEGRLPHAGHLTALRQEIRSYIGRHLADPAVTPSGVAAAHHISLRYLHRLFEPEEYGVAEYIRRERLLRCRSDLADPLLAGRTVAEIGARWGFPDPAGFSRVFTRAYGIPPGEYRRAALSAD